MSASDKVILDQILEQCRSAQESAASPDEFWEFFTAEKVLREYGLSPSDIKSGIVGQTSNGDKQGSDGGIDSMYVLINGRPIMDCEQAESLLSSRGDANLEIIIIQAKGDSGFGLDVLNRLSNTCESIFNIALQPENFAETYNSPLMDIIKRFRAAHQALLSRHPHISVNLFYVAKSDASTINQTIQAKAVELERKVQATLSTVKNCKFVFLGARDIIDIHMKPPRYCPILPCVSRITDNKGGYVAIVRVQEFVKMITLNGALREHLFEANVRDYEGDVDVNKQIRQTLIDPKGADFWWLNNGITILSPKVGGDSTQFAIDDPSIVNGLQTSKEIFEHFNQPPIAGANDGHVVVRIIASPDEELQDRIIRATNSQTKIPPQFLRSSDDVQRNIEMFFKAAGFHYDRRKNSWRNHNQLSLDRIVGMSELARSVGAIFKFEPNHARARPSRYFSNDHYQKVFNEKIPLPIYLVCAVMKKRAEAFLKKSEPQAAHRNNLLYYVLMAARPLVSKNGRKRIHLKDVDVRSDMTSAFTAALAIVRPIYFNHGENDAAAKGPGMVADLKQALTSKKKQKEVDKPLR